MKKKTVRDIDVAGKRVLLRVDFNVPLDEHGVILDDLRIRASVPTVEFLRAHNARVVVCAHIGRPKAKVVESLRLAPVAKHLSEILGTYVQVPSDCVGPEAEAAVARLQPAEVLLLENLRFHAGEEANDPEFARKLASLADVFVNDAFGVAHRAHASTEGVAHLLPAVAGLLMEKEIDYVSRIVSQPERPLAAIIGGAKVSDKMVVLSKLVSLVDVLVIGGGMANTFLKAQGRSVGDSLVEDDQLDTGSTVLGEAKRRGVNLLLPVDVVIADAFSADADYRTVSLDDVQDGWRIMDVGEQSVAHYAEALTVCKTIAWNGPLGVAEFPAFARGSRALAEQLAEMSATTIVGGGETAALVQQTGLAAKFDHVSTGGGAFLECLEGRELPGVAALLDA